MKLFDVVDPKLKTPLSKSGTSVQINSVFAIVLEAYQLANEMGWETKALDPLNEALRRLNP